MRHAASASAAVPAAARRGMRIEVFASFDEEDRAEHRRLAGMTPEERCREFAVIQERLWGKKWTEAPMVRTATFERVPWLKG